MEKQFIFWIILIQITARILVIVGGDANPENSGSGSLDSSSCIQTYTVQTNCSDNERQLRYYYNNETNTCAEYYTCNASSQDGYTSLEECKISCGIETPCPPLTPVTNAHLVYSNCKTPSRCHAFYRCEIGYIRFDDGKERRCVSGIWTPKPFCAKIALYYKGKQLEGKSPVVNLKNFTEETIECKLLPKLPPNTSITWSPSDNNVRITWNNTYRSLQLTVLSTNGHPSYSKTYKCSATINVNGITNKLELKAEVKVNVTYDSIIYKNPIIYQSEVNYVSSTDLVSGNCPCRGSPKPLVTWYIDDTKLENSSSVKITDITKNQQDFTFSKLTVSNPHSGKYKCKCSNTIITVEGSDHIVTIPGGRKRRSTTKTTDIQTNLCTILQDQSSVAVVGQVKRHLPSIYLLHVKIIKQLQLHGHQPTLNPVLKIQSYDQTIPRNKPQLMVLKLQDNSNQYHLVAQVPYFKHLETILKKECHL